MKTMKAVLRYQKQILKETENRKPVALCNFTIKPGETESFKHALEDLVIAGMITCVALNPVILIKRIA